MAGKFIQSDETFMLAGGADSRLPHRQAGKLVRARQEAQAMIYGRKKPQQPRGLVAELARGLERAAAVETDFTISEIVMSVISRIRYWGCP